MNPPYDFILGNRILGMTKYLNVLFHKSWELVLDFKYGFLKNLETYSLPIVYQIRQVRLVDIQPLIPVNVAGS